MSVTALTTTTKPSGSLSPSLAKPTRWPSQQLASHASGRHPIASPPTALPPLTVTIELTLPGDSAGRAFLETLEALRETVRRAGGGSVNITPALGTVKGAERRQTNQASRSVGARTVDLAADNTTVRVLPDERSVWVGNKEIHLSRLEFDLLLYLANNPRRAFSRRQLLEGVWGYTQASRRTIDVHIRRLRMKLGDVTPLVTTVRGIGYRLDGHAKIIIVQTARPGVVGRQLSS